MAGYFTVSAFCVFQFVGFAMWVNLHHNSSAGYCRYDKIGGTGNFYAYGELCNIVWTYWVPDIFIQTIVGTVILQIPMVALVALDFILRLQRYLRGTRG